MFSYYTFIILMIWIALTVLGLLVRENGRLSREDRRLLHLTYTLIGVAALAEWCGVQLNGVQSVPKWVLLSVKCADYILTPMAGGALVWQMRLRNKWYVALISLLAANTLYQLIAVFYGWTVQVNDQHIYSHGPVFIGYLAMCLVIVGLVFTEFMIYGKTVSRENIRSLFVIMLLVLAGFLIQELFPSHPRTAYLGMTFGAIMMYIHYTEISALAIDDYLMNQQILLETDALTGVSNRRRYMAALAESNAAGQLPEDLVAFVIDINGLKEINDRLGHEVGDELIRGAARCVDETLTGNGLCCRTGGDEFVVLTRMDANQVQQALESLHKAASEWSSERMSEMNLAGGYALASSNTGFTAEELVQEADLAMYEAKAEYYARTGLERRKRRRTERTGRQINAGRSE